MPSYTQDMPPPGGYKNFDWAKKIPTNRWSGYKQFGVFIGFTTAAWVAFYFSNKKKLKRDMEMREARMALVPLFLAEQQRLFLKQMRENRDEENALMKNVPGWKTGTLWGEPVYHNVRDRWIMPSKEEFFAHCSYRDKFIAVNDRLKRN